MRKNFLIQGLHLLCVALLLSGTAIQGVVNWNGGVQSTDVVDDNLVISNDNQINGGVQIIANTVDITVSVNLGDAIVRGTPTGPSRLFLRPAAGRTITFDLQDSLSFLGSANGTPLLILVDGGGQVAFSLGDDSQLIFNNAQFYLQMRISNYSTVLFTRANTASNQDVFITVEQFGKISYVAENPALNNPGEVAAIAFNPTNNGLGRMTLVVQSEGTVLVGGSLIQPGLTPPNIFLTDINPNIPAGDDAQLQIVSSNSAYGSGLLVVNENIIYPSLASDPFCTGTFDGSLAYGFILRDHATVDVGDYTYLDYVAAATNTCVHPNIEVDVLNGRSVESIVKARNASAFIVDSVPTGSVFENTASIELYDYAGLFFRSGCDKNGVISEDFIIDPANKTAGEGNIVFDVEGVAAIVAHTANNRVEIFSLEVTATGAPIDYNVNVAPFIFPMRTFAVDLNDVYLTYNSGCFLVNDRLNLIGFNDGAGSVGLLKLAHTDENHLVLEKNDCISEPTYVGGDHFIIKQDNHRPTIGLFNARFDFYTNAAFSGVDLRNFNFYNLLAQDAANLSEFVFYYNGNIVDNGTGRQVIFGTLVGAKACDDCTILDKDAHVDVMQEFPTFGVAQGQELDLLTLPSNSFVVENLPDVSGQFSLHSMYLGWTSNISVGTNANTLDFFGDEYLLTTTPTLSIGNQTFGSANYISFVTRGGLNRTPDTSNVTGQGGIFVDKQGFFTITPGNLANISTMVTRSHNGRINLPKNQVFFNLHVGIAEWNLDLSDPSQQIIVGETEFLSDYNLNWLAAKKDYTVYTPYFVEAFPPCQCAPVTRANITAIPTVQGHVQQLQIQGSRIGDPAAIKIDCGWVEELVFLPGCNSGEAPTALVTLENEGRVGLGTAERNVDSLYASVKLGINGVTLIVNGNGQVDLNSDILIDNICSIMPGPDLSPTATLTFFSNCCRTLRVTKTGILDLSAFNSPDQIIRFAGDVQVVVEPGATIVLSRSGGVKMQFFDTSSLIIEPFNGCKTLSGATRTSDSDDRRATMLGQGVVSLEDNTFMTVNRNAYFGIQTDVGTCNILTTSIVFNLENAAQIQIGKEFTELGGIFQVGNPTFQSVEEGEFTIPAQITFELLINGENAQVGIGSRGMLGFAVGIVNDNPALPNDWLVDTLFNVVDVIVEIPDGTFNHNHLFAGNDERAALLAVGPVTSNMSYFFSFDVFGGQVLGGGNFISLLSTTTTIPGAINPIVLAQDGQINERLTVGMLASTPLLKDLSGNYKADLVNPATQSAFYNYLKVADTGTIANIRAVASDPSENFYGVLLGYVSQGQIIRRVIESFVGPDGQASSEGSELTSIGAANVIFRGADPENNNDEPIVNQIPQLGTSQRSTKA